MLRPLAFASLLGCASALHGAAARTDHVEAELVAARTAIDAGKPILVALRLKMIPHWHTYWRNPGDSGQPTAIRWQLPLPLKIRLAAVLEDFGAHAVA